MDSLQTKDMRLEQLMPMIRGQLEAGHTVRFKPRRVSMLPVLRQDIDSVVLSPLPQKLRKYDLPLYQRDDGKYVLHRIVAVGQTYTCVGDNQFELEPGVRRDQMIGLVKAYYRGEKYRSVSNPVYWLYVRGRHYSRPLRRRWRRLRNRIKNHMK